jgi:predicted N-acetyltransferase YhbS
MPMLPEGLRVRSATSADVEAVAAFNATVHHGERYRDWTLDLVGGDHPTVEPDDVFLVTTPDGAIVSSLLLIPQTWTYDGLRFGIGQVEFVGTAVEHRRKGLVRALMDALHERAAERGLPVLAISGIPWFYVQFGYAYGLDLWVGRQAWRSQLSEVQPGAGFRVRSATDADAARIAAISAQASRYLVALPRDESLWRYEVSGRREGSNVRYVVEVLESANGDVIGVIARSPRLLDGRMALVCCELAPEAAWLDAGPAVLRHCLRAGIEIDEGFRGLVAGLGRSHPLYDACPDILVESVDLATWYIRVPDLAGFLRLIVPALDRRLAESVAANWTGDVRVSTYRQGLRLIVQKGKVAGVERVDPDGAGAALPLEQLIQLVFGFRDLDTLIAERYDCWADDPSTHAVLNACFPRRPSNVWPLS